MSEVSIPEEGRGGSERVVVAIDGPAASGKSTTARLVAQHFGFLYLDTGALYRAITLKGLQRGVPAHDRAALTQLVAETEVRLEAGAENGVRRVRMDGCDVSQEIRSPRVSKEVSAYSAAPVVRQRLVELQRVMASEGSVVVEGRDIATVVFPDAPVKIFLVADLDARAERRFREQQAAGDDSQGLDEIREGLAERDFVDSGRDHSPLRKAEDAIEIDTSGLSVEEQVERVIRACRARIGLAKPGECLPD